MGNDNVQEEFTTPFGKFAEKIVGEFKLAKPQMWKISARMMDGIMMMEDWKRIAEPEKDVMVFLRIQYRLHDENKNLLFVHAFKLGDVVDLMDKDGVVAQPEKLPLQASKLDVVVKGPNNKYNYGKKANGEDFDGKKLVGKVFKRCQDESGWFKPACVVDDKNTGKTGGK